MHPSCPLKWPVDQREERDTRKPCAEPPMTQAFSIPSPPQALARVIQAASDPGVPVTALASCVGNDPGLSAQLLRMVNSSLYSRGASISTVGRAVAVLGNRSLRNLALCIAVQNCAGKALGAFDLPSFWEDSLRRAVAARMLAERYGAEQVDPMEAFTFGLLQDLGVLALVQTFPERAARWNEHRGRMPEDRRRHELEVFGTTHDEVAEQLVEAWSLPPELAMPMRHHHHPARAPAEYRGRCQIAGQAELLAQVLGGSDKRAALGAARAGLLREINVDTAAVDTMLAELAVRVDEVGRELGFRVGKQPSMEEILVAANAGLVELNLTYEEVVNRLERTLAEKDQLAQQLAARNRELEQLSITDTLTGLPNRRALSGRLNYEISRVAREGGQLAFVMGDLDRFKLVNDTWGHEFGDQVLVGCADALRTASRASDMVARVGGEEMGVVVPGLAAEAAAASAEQLRAGVAALELRSPDGIARRFTVSLGLASITGPFEGAFDPDAIAASLYRAADRALYEAKQQGRNCVRVAPTEVSWLQQLRAA
jgi:two-component system, cell cycle response regulator